MKQREMEAIQKVVKRDNVRERVRRTEIEEEGRKSQRQTGTERGKGRQELRRKKNRARKEKAICSGQEGKKDKEYSFNKNLLSRFYLRFLC